MYGCAGKVNSGTSMIKSTQKFLVIVLTLFSLVCHSAETKHSIGFGVQYGGLAGWQISQVSDTGITRFAAGLGGITIGHDRFVSPDFGLPNMSLGGQVFTGVLTGAGINANYYFGSRDNANWVLGVDLFTGQQILDGLAGSEREGYRAYLFLSMGYRF